MKIFRFPRFALLSAIIALFATIFFTACATQDLRSNSISSPRWIDEAMREVCWSVESGTQCEEILQSTCEAGDYHNCTLLGYTYTNHLNVPTDDYRAKEDKAIALFKTACEGKNGSGCSALGILQGNDDFAVKGCEYGDSFACSHIVANRASGANIEVDGETRFAPRFDEKVVLWALNREIELLKDECAKAELRLKNENDKDRIATREAFLKECQAELQNAQSIDLQKEAE